MATGEILLAQIFFCNLYFLLWYQWANKNKINGQCVELGRFSLNNAGDHSNMLALIKPYWTEQKCWNYGSESVATCISLGLKCSLENNLDNQAI